jgi:hypothetical protein
VKRRAEKNKYTKPEDFFKFTKIMPGQNYCDRLQTMLLKCWIIRISSLSDIGLN